MNKLWPLTFIVWAASWSNFSAAQTDQNTVRFVGEVLIGTEYSKSDQVCMRWTKSPSLSTFAAENHHANAIQNVIRQLNECLPAEQQITISSRNDDSADIKVHFVPHKQFADLAWQNGYAYKGEDWGAFLVRWNGNYEIESALIMIAKDKLRGSRLQHFLLEEITQSLGLAGDSPRFDDSVFYENSGKREFGTATRLSDLDKKLLRYLYQHVRPGMHPVELGMEMAKSW